MSWKGRIKASGGIVAIAATMLMIYGPGAAQAVSYPAGGSSFSGGPEGWKVSGEPKCNIGVLGTVGVCKASGGYDEADGHPAGSLAADTEIVVNLGGLLKAEVGFESPTFKVGEGGSATLRLERELAAANLLNLSPSATYKVTLVDHTAGTSAEVLSDSVGKSEVGFSGKTGPATVVAGHMYSIAIATETSSSVASIGLLGSSALRFDNVALVVGRNSGEEGGGGAGSNGGKLDPALLVGPAVLKGNRLIVRAKCPKANGAACGLSLRGLLKKRKAATRWSRGRVRSGKVRRFVLRVKPKARRVIATRKRLMVEEHLKAGAAKGRFVRNLRLIRR